MLRFGLVVYQAFVLDHPNPGAYVRVFQRHYYAPADGSALIICREMGRFQFSMQRTAVRTKLWSFFPKHALMALLDILTNGYISPEGLG
jgi:hypothetical protein